MNWRDAGREAHEGKVASRSPAGATPLALGTRVNLSSIERRLRDHARQHSVVPAPGAPGDERVPPGPRLGPRLVLPLSPSPVRERTARGGSGLDPAASGVAGDLMPPAPDIDHILATEPWCVSLTPRPAFQPPNTSHRRERNNDDASDSPSPRAPPQVPLRVHRRGRVHRPHRLRRSLRRRTRQPLLPEHVHLSQRRPAPGPAGSRRRALRRLEHFPLRM